MSVIRKFYCIAVVRSENSDLAIKIKFSEISDLTTAIVGSENSDLAIPPPITPVIHNHFFSESGPISVLKSERNLIAIGEHVPLALLKRKLSQMLTDQE